MADLYASITSADRATLERLAQAMEVRAAQAQQRVMLGAYLEDLAIPSGARVLEIGSGTGAVARVLAAQPAVAEVVGVDPSPFFVARARELSAAVPRLSFSEGDGKSLPFDSRSFDVAVAHTVLSHVPEPERLLAEASRVLKPGGRLAVFDGDYSTATVATGDFDPLQFCVDAAFSKLAHDRWIVRRIPRLVSEAGFRIAAFRSLGVAEVEEGYILTLVDRGADFLAADGRIGAPLAAALKAEARRRARANAFFGHIAYASLVGQKDPV